MNISEFDYNLPAELIAQQPIVNRVESRLLVLDKNTGAINHSVVRDLAQWLKPGDLMVVNNSKVIKARLLGTVQSSLVKVECFFVKQPGEHLGIFMLNPGKKILPGMRILCRKGDLQVSLKVLEKLSDGQFLIELPAERNLIEILEAVGHVPLPPYIKRSDEVMDHFRYQTVYAKFPGSIAAPTAGLHFSNELFDELEKVGVEKVEVTLHVGYGTFKPVRVSQIEEHQVDQEYFTVTAEVAKKINLAKIQNRRILAVGTTTTRVLESSADKTGLVMPQSRMTDLYIYPGFKFKVIDGLMTNFHLPKSSLLLLVSTFGGQEKILNAYQEAVKSRYRFYSYGDAMLII